MFLGSLLTEGTQHCYDDWARNKFPGQILHTVVKNKFYKIYLGLCCCDRPQPFQKALFAARVVLLGLTSVETETALTFNAFFRVYSFQLKLSKLFWGTGNMRGMFLWILLIWSFPPVSVLLARHCRLKSINDFLVKLLKLMAVNHTPFHIFLLVTQT